MVMSLSRVLWKVRSKAPTVTASVQGTVSVTGEGYTTIRDWADAATAGTAQARPVATERREISMRGTPVRAHKRIQVHTIRFVKAGVFGYGRRCI